MEGNCECPGPITRAFSKGNGNLCPVCDKPFTTYTEINVEQSGKSAEGEHIYANPEIGNGPGNNEMNNIDTESNDDFEDDFGEDMNTGGQYNQQNGDPRNR